jgi:hypothetical protein
LRYYTLNLKPELCKQNKYSKALSIAVEKATGLCTIC